MNQITDTGTPALLEAGRGYDPIEDRPRHDRGAVRRGTRGFHRALPVWPRRCHEEGLGIVAPGIEAFLLDLSPAFGSDHLGG